MTKPVFVCKAKGPVVSKRSGKPSKPDKLNMAKRISENLRTRGTSADDGKADMEARKWR